MPLRGFTSDSLHRGALDKDNCSKTVANNNKQTWCPGEPTLKSGHGVSEVGIISQDNYILGLCVGPGAWGGRGHGLHPPGHWLRPGTPQDCFVLFFFFKGGEIQLMNLLSSSCISKPGIIITKHASIHPNTHTYTYAHTYTHMCMHIYILHTHIHTHIHAVYTYMHTYTYDTCIYSHTHIYIYI